MSRSKIVLFYLPPCGNWYVHSHKLYDTGDEAFEAAKKFLVPGTKFAPVTIDISRIDAHAYEVPA